MVFAVAEYFGTKARDATKKVVEHQDKHDRIKIYLTAARLNQYEESFLPRVLPTEEDYLALKSLVRSWGEKLLRTDVTIKPVDFPKACAKYNKMLDLFIINRSEQLFPIIFFASQLAQFYTVVCHRSFSAELNLVQFEHFLGAHETAFGDTTYNRFIIEHKLILMYNEFAMLVKAAAGEIAPIPRASEKARLLQGRWEELQQIVAGFVRSERQCVFSRYLNFVINYTMAKALEMDVHLSIKDVAPADMDVVSLDDQWKHVQHTYIDRAKESLEYTRALSSPDAPPRHIPGMEFCFGQGVLTKMPVTDFTLIRTHLSDLSTSLSPRSF